jgi:hypothetical protein
MSNLTIEVVYILWHKALIFFTIKKKGEIKPVRKFESGFLSNGLNITSRNFYNLFKLKVFLWLLNFPHSWNNGVPAPLNRFFIGKGHHYVPQIVLNIEYLKVLI